MAKYRTIILACVIGLAATPSFAATEAECETAIKEAQAAAAESPILGDNDERSDELSTMLARAGEAGEQGNYQECLDLVRDARGAAGLEN